MIADLKKQWKERSIRKLAYMTQGKLHFEPINFTEYEKSCTRTEMPNKFKKVGSPKVIAEEVFDYAQYEQSKSTRTSPKSSKSYSITMLNKSSKKPFYYVRNNEIMSIDQFFDLYQSAVGQQKLKEKFDNKYKLEEKKRKIEEIHKRNQRLMNHAVSANNSLILQPDKLDLKTDYSVNVQTPAAANRMDLSQQISEETPYIDPRPVRQIKFSPRLEGKIFSPNERVSVPRPIIRHRTGSLDEGCQRGMTADQKFTEREIYKHLVRMTVSPKPVRNASEKKNSKEKVYASMFKDPKMMDCMVENSIKRAQHLIVKKNQGAAQSYRLTTNKSDGINYRVDSISEIESKDHEREGELFGQEFSMANLKEDSKKNSIAIAKKIKVNIKHIDNLLRVKSPREKDLRSPNVINRSIIMDVKSKNKFPLRSTIAQRYNFGEKLLDQRKMADQIHKVSKSYRKDAVDSAIKSQTYVSYYN